MAPQTPVWLSFSTQSQSRSLTKPLVVARAYYFDCPVPHLGPHIELKSMLNRPLQHIDTTQIIKTLTEGRARPLSASRNAGGSTNDCVDKGAPWYRWSSICSKTQVEHGTDIIWPLQTDDCVRRETQKGVSCHSSNTASSGQIIAPEIWRFFNRISHFSPQEKCRI